MCLEPFTAAGLFILGRGVLLLQPLLWGVVRETEKEREGQSQGEQTCSATPHHQKQSQARRECKREKTDSTLLPELRLPHSS